MRDSLKILLQIRDEGVLADFAIGGAIAASFYTPAVATEDPVGVELSQYESVQRDHHRGDSVPEWTDAVRNHPC